MASALPKQMQSLMEQGRLRLNEPMSRHTTLHIGGIADILADPMSEDEIICLLTEARDIGFPVTVIGKGSNLVVRDGGIRGLVIRIASGFSKITQSNHTLIIHGGASMAAIAVAAAEANLTGFEFAYGIPGTICGGICMNAGAYNGEMKDVISSIRGVSYDGKPFTRSSSQIAFSYRYCRYHIDPAIITGAEIRLLHGQKAMILQKMEVLNRRRREKQPLTEYNCGSVFKRPDNAYAGSLIENSRLKGARMGQLEVSRKHAGFFINKGDGTANDFLALMALVQHEVYCRYGVMLQPEVKIIGVDL
jgi:UDP-N-acetylmuramate dehydrogenase